MQSILWSAARRETAVSSDTVTRRAADHRMDWTEPLHRRWPMGIASLVVISEAIASDDARRETTACATAGDRSRALRRADPRRGSVERVTRGDDTHTCGMAHRARKNAERNETSGAVDHHEVSMTGETRRMLARCSTSSMRPS